MHRSDDIANLFQRFGGSADSYREIDPSYDYAEETVTPFTPALSEPQPLDTVSPVEALALPVETPAVVQAPGTLPVVESSPIAREVAPAAPGNSTSLSRLLAEIEQQREAVVVDVPVPSATHPTLKAKVIAVISAKGGVGKSTLAGALASAIKRSGGRTLALDLDPQNALCLYLGGNEQWPGIAQDDPQQQDWRQLIREGFAASHCLAYGVVSEEERLDFENSLRADPTWLARHLVDMGLGERDTVIIDTPSGATAYLAQALAIADIALVVTHADAASYTSLNQMERLLAPYLQRDKPLQCKYVINQLDTSRQFSLDMCEVLKKTTGNQLLGVIRQDHFLSEALAYDRNPLAHTPSTRGCQDTLDIAGSLCELLMQGTQESHLS
ncbi:cellulose biosynthesis protein BcsQ [Pseudomonas gingeri]|uniref:Cellulose synthase operon protein YhjQ n=1 Tax=Pseudomonas gingeri TaxID=117681 RepID=A0A7Y8CMG9_9PSED|nr:cellulose biosynthesis protein BcsQ [Pseudomonas gingeri]NWA01380.1 cellulose synthase operon protein YhjQ [Pseudomonas gingeri]NWA13817.1 cellulose synthase operon protein YhjQ [Pseudomonas gingeri]NWA52823.1 cellulose synthase operon protein YhjQ [Pseudomonas gingeri]NWA96320.1 cellulose synthase operon protein YhjQ [Pseudomonas gingeri]NWB00044.1 cellulose synthase operon protein YhjQ [Pseudomonas gingeri]